MMAEQRDYDKGGRQCHSRGTMIDEGDSVRAEGL